ncbi:MAG: hypothetical protein F4X12_09195 [Acidobacteriia bacterium]|nr:hypothetical protein [Terriglobia bacterium]
MARRTETSINNDLAAALRRLHPAWTNQTVLAESTGVLTEGAGRRPDIVITNESRAGGVILETEFDPARAVESEARDRLGNTFAADGSPVEQVVAVRIPEEARTPDARLETLTYSYKVCANGTEATTWFPGEGWITGTLADLAGFIETVEVSPRKLAAGVNALETGVAQATNIIRRGMAGARRGGLAEMATALHQRDGEQTTRMAAAIMANALVVHYAIAGTEEAIEAPSHPRLRGHENVLLPGAVLETWRAILEVNYWPIFKVAHDVLNAMDTATAGRALKRLDESARELVDLGATTIGDLAGQMFGQLISDRKFLATFYTQPSSATLLAELAVARLGVDWSDGDRVCELRVADLACGTGALLSAVYRRMTARLRRAGLDDAELHSRIIENVLIGCDIMPAATHLTSAQIASAHPTVTFGNTRVSTMPYGAYDPHDGKGARPFIGSLELLESGAKPALFGTGATTVTGTGDVPETGMNQIDLPNGSLDLVVMNPPFTRPTNHEVANVPVPSFAGFETSEREQRAMSTRLAQLRRRLPHARAGDSNAGLASHFADLAHLKLRPGGVLALIVPAPVVSGGAWSRTRRLLETGYDDITVVTIAEDGVTDRAFSADTGMADTILLATKRAEARDSEESPKARYLVLDRLPASITAAVEVARASSPSTGGTHLAVGTQRVGWSVKGTFGADATGHPTGVSNPDVAAAASALADGALVLPRHESLALPMASLGNLGRRGPVDRDISGITKGRNGTPDEPRGPFDVVRLGDRAAYRRASWPVLWSHKATAERQMTVLPCSEGFVRTGMRDAALRLWKGYRNADGALIAGAGRLHLNRDFQLNSQSLGACLTPMPTIGGRAWPSFAPDPAEEGQAETWEKALGVWLNTTPGLLTRWWVSTRQQRGRACLTVTTVGAIPVLDLRLFPSEAVTALAATFDRFAARDLLPANEAYRDPARRDLDEAVLCGALDLPESILEPLATLREQWCAEPSVHGGKTTRPT